MMATSGSGVGGGVPFKIAQFLDKNGDTLQNMALLAYLKQGEEAKPALEAITTAKVGIVDVCI
jgi:hypothetical protein